MADGRELDVSYYVCRSRGRKVRERKTVCRKDHWMRKVPFLSQRRLRNEKELANTVQEAAQA